MNAHSNTPGDTRRRDEPHDGPDSEPGKHPRGKPGDTPPDSTQKGPGSASADVGMTSDGRDSTEKQRPRK